MKYGDEVCVLADNLPRSVPYQTDNIGDSFGDTGAIIRKEADRRVLVTR
jgi:hypothetical protein